MLAAALDALRSGDWLDHARRQRIAVLLGFAYAATWAYLLSGAGGLDPLGRAVGSDFAAFYGVSRALLHGAPAASLYTPSVLNEAIRDLSGGAAYVWLYPPPALLPYWPLANMPYLAALAAWITFGLLSYLAAIRRAVAHQPVIVPAVLFPAVHVCATHGHNGLLNAGLLGGGIALMATSPFTAGALLGGVMALKPHLALLVPVALLSGRRWRTLGAMTATMAIMCGVTTLGFGLDAWRAFFRSIPLARLMVETEGVSYANMASVFSTARLLGCGVPVAYGAQGIAAIGAVCATVWLWARPGSSELKGAALLVAGPLATPYVYDYDLPVIGVGLALWAAAAIRDGWRPWEKSVLFAAWAAPLFGRPLATACRLGILPMVLGLALAVIVRRGATPAPVGAAPQ